MARPRTYPFTSEARTRRIVITVSDEELEAIKERAETVYRRPVANLARLLLLGDPIVTDGPDVPASHQERAAA